MNLFGLADLQVAPTTASVSLDRSTGTVTPSCNAGLVSYSTSGSLPTFVNILGAGRVWSTRSSGPRPAPAARWARLHRGSLLTGTSTYTPDGNLLTCDTSAPGTTASAKVGVLNLGLLSALQGGIGLNVWVTSASPGVHRRHAGRRHPFAGHAGEPRAATPVTPRRRPRV